MKKRHSGLIALVVIVIIVIGGLVGFIHQRTTQQNKVVRLGLVGTDSQPVWNNVRQRLKKQGITIKYVTFNDYVQPDVALKEGKIDMHSCLTRYYFDSYNKREHAHLTSIGNTVISPLGVYSKKYQNIKDLPDGVTVAIPNEPTTLGRGLNVLQSAGLIKVKKSSGIKPSLNDITSNPKNLKFKEVDPATAARALNSVDASIINGNYAEAANLNPKKDAIYLEPVNQKAKPYVNIIAVQAKNKDNKTYKKVVEAYQTEATKKAIEKTYHGSEVAAWPIFGKN
ncbi:MetQ/NlpA family ABC transporter substrate-binding protein [Limosilactobacillus coleohominis]|uniref:Lipoprotein n=1 Tax=Limosilactobacillus coleohominis TaxID=181675 RepID=A0ABS2GVZ9_9LACO|nr:MetQ/NlpA family ABC transporter substrate-binding protein [Limosilactobacillus coleohominis]MBM6939991.1 MetQ/NlpA family ABC transporter substrate-binding protein [Limosilactobacillus coleohominis]MBM6954449.1 MetQ/NlpA family ABC transporter substrate-binding protein [Limosilactobacillus coleohominis]